jgi:CheY-like chemotaxis protein
MIDEARNILVAVRDVDARVSLYSTLSDHGYLVATLTPGPKALEYVARVKPDVILCDARLRFAEETDFLEALRRMSPRSRIVLMSAMEELPSSMLDERFDELLVKPVRPETLLRRVGRLASREAVA